MTLFDRALRAPLRLEDIRTIRLEDEVLGEAARFLGLGVAA